MQEFSASQTKMPPPNTMCYFALLAVSWTYSCNVYNILRLNVKPQIVCYDIVVFHIQKGRHPSWIVERTCEKFTAYMSCLPDISSMSRMPRLFSRPVSPRTKIPHHKTLKTMIRIILQKIVNVVPVNPTYYMRQTCNFIVVLTLARMGS